MGWGIATSLTATELTELASLVKSLEGLAMSVVATVDIEGCQYEVEFGYDETGTFGLLGVGDFQPGK